jgi:alkane 1-monooxygenase
MNTPNPALTFVQKLNVAIYSIGFLLAYAFFWWPLLLLATPSDWPWLIPLNTFVVLPLLDAIISEYRHNFSDAQVQWSKSQNWIRWLPVLSLPLFFGYQFIIAGYFQQATGTLDKIGWLFSAGIAGGVLAINVGHELIHRKTKWEQRTGGLLLASVGYGSFKVEHVHGHHVWVATPEDMTTAQKGMTVYRFWLRALTKTPVKSFKIAQQRAAKKKSKLNEFGVLYLVSAMVLLCYYLMFGFTGMVYWLCHSLIAILLLETVNYIEHYGLEREKRGARYEPTTHLHSWNSSRLVTNFVLFNLQRHSDHHAHASRPYQTLRHFDQSPQMPQGYAAMIMMSLLPPLWFKVMHRKLALRDA